MPDRNFIYSKPSFIDEVIDMMGCKKCMKLGGLLLLILGLVFLLRDLAIWNFWNIQWWTAAFLLAGLCKLGMSSCPDCQAMCGMMKKK